MRVIVILSPIPNMTTTFQFVSLLPKSPMPNGHTASLSSQEAAQDAYLTIQETQDPLPRAPAQQDVIEAGG